MIREDEAPPLSTGNSKKNPSATTAETTVEPQPKASVDEEPKADGRAKPLTVVDREKSATDDNGLLFEHFLISISENKKKTNSLSKQAFFYSY